MRCITHRIHHGLQAERRRGRQVQEQARMAGRRTRGSAAAMASAAAAGSKKARARAKEEEHEDEEEVVVEATGGKKGKAAAAAANGRGNNKRKVPVAKGKKAAAASSRRAKEKEEEDEEDEEEESSSEEEEDEESSEEDGEGEKDVVKAQAPFKGVGGGVEGLSAFEKERLENIRKNREYLQALGLGDTRAEIGIAATAARAKQPKLVKRVSKGLKPAKREPMRKSRRLEGQTAPHYNEEKLIMEVEAQAEKEKRMDEGPLTLETLNRTEEGGEAFLGLLKELLAEQGQGKGDAAAGASASSSAASAGSGAGMDMDYAARLAALTLDHEKDIAKLTPSRVTAMAVHPSERNLVVVAADVDGYFGVWQVDAPASDETGGVYKFRPHISKVASLQYHPHDPAQLISASHDGTLRCLDLTKQVFDLLLATGEKGFEDSGFTCASMAPHSPHSVFLAGHESSTALLDLRTKALAWVNGSAHAKKVNSVEAHPTREHLFVSASTDRVVRLWDARKPKKEIWGIPHTNSLNNATFNPTGSHMLVTCQDHNLYLHADPAATAQAPSVKDAQHKIKHNNNTGRWLTKFWPMWDPKHPDSFVVGSLEQPRRIEVYSAAAGFQIASVRSEYMVSVQSVCVFHPTRNVLVGANSSGRTHVFRGP